MFDKVTSLLRSKISGSSATPTRPANSVSSAKKKNSTGLRGDGRAVIIRLDKEIDKDDETSRSSTISEDTFYGIPRQKYHISSSETPRPVPTSGTKCAKKAPPAIPLSWQYASPHWIPEDPNWRPRHNSDAAHRKPTGRILKTTRRSAQKIPDLYRMKRCHSCGLKNPIDARHSQVRCHNAIFGRCNGLISTSYVERVEAKQLDSKLWRSYSARSLPA